MAASIAGLTRRDLLIATIFTQVEVVILTIWAALVLLAVGIDPTMLVTSGYGQGAIVSLEIGLETEHLISRLHG